MSFMLDPPLLVAAGAAVETAAPDRRAARVADAAILAVFLGFSTALYARAPGLGPLWKPFRARDGRDFMVNSGVTRLRTDPTPTALNVAAAAIFATYPLWLLAGHRLGRFLRERRAPRAPHAPGRPVEPGRPTEAEAL